MRGMRGWSAALGLLLCSAGALGCATAPPVRNVVLFVGDGMGLTTVVAARILEGQRRGEPGEENRLAFETLPRVALVRTFGTDLQVSESAATMSAITTGFRTRAGVLGLDETAVLGDFRSVAHARRPTLLEEAEARGLATGVVTTTRVTHATPAACYAHVPHRDWESDAWLPPEATAAGFPDIARQLVEFAPGDGVDVVLGGGRAQFLPQATPDPEEPTSGERRDGRNLIEEWRTRFPDGVHVRDRTGFEAVDPVSTHRLLGLFSASHMAFESDRALDRAGEPSLSEMTAKALAILSRNPDGFLLVVEGGRIDHAHHAGNAHRALAETIELSNAVRTALAATDPRETLVVVTADHDHVLTFAGYPARGNPILGLVVEPDEKGVRSAEPARDANGLPYTTLGYANGPGWRERRPNLGVADTAALDFRQEATLPLIQETHGGTDVPLYAGGAGSELFGGVIDQPDVHERIVRALGWR